MTDYSNFKQRNADIIMESDMDQDITIEEIKAASRKVNNPSEGHRDNLVSFRHTGRFTNRQI